MTNFSKNTPLMTWLDVERRFREIRCIEDTFLDAIVGIDCYADGAEISLVSAESATHLRAWLTKYFGNTLDENENKLELSIDKISYPLETIISEEKRNPPVRYPLWHDLAYIINKNSIVPNNFPNALPNNLHICAFHSFKGGVGRTTVLITHLIAYLENSQKRKTKVLLIDADLEAPGITYWLDSVNRPSISFVRFLEAVHYPPSSVNAAIQYCAAELRKTSINFNGHEIFVLPSCVNPEQPIELLDTPVLPEHLARNPKNPWYVGDVIAQLATELKTELVLLDLRAGLSELASPLLFDPRIERFIVSTIAPQSINGVALILEKMALLRSINENTTAIPSVILSLLTPALRESQDYETAIQRLNTAFPTEDGLEFIEASFDASLMCIRDFNQAIELTKNSSLFNRIKNWVATVLPIPVQVCKESDLLSQKISKRTEEAKSLAKVCEKYIYAENGEGENLLVTEPLLNLAKHFENTIPITISMGAKGAGKTFNFLQLCRLKTWENFLEKIEIPVVDNKAYATLIFPLLSSKNLQTTAQKIVEECRENCFQKLEIASTFSEITLRDRIQQNIKNKANNWLEFWTSTLLKIFNVQGESLKDLHHFLALKKNRLVILIDGLEDQFPTLTDESEQQAALKVLLNFPNRIEEIRDSHLGMIAFIRSDYVRMLEQQNAAQFEARYKPFILEWTAESFLRLAYWICAQAGLKLAEQKNSETLSSHELLTQLYELWGQTLGTAKAKEARSARWIFTVLCDLNGRLQARDLVRFLYYAAQKSQTGQTKWEDRILLPEAIRAATSDCSRKKVEEALEEIYILKQWNEKLSQIDSSLKIIPFAAAHLGLTPEMTKALQELGIIYEEREKNDDEKRFYLPESYRSGLGFTLASTGRPKVLALIQRNFKIPF